MRKCKKCGIEKDLNLFRKNGNYIRHTCKECLNAPYRTGKPRTTTFKKGILSTPKPFVKGQIPWNKGKKLWKNGGSNNRGSEKYKNWANLIKERDE